MEDPTVKAGPAGRLLRACQRNRLEKRLMSDAYEWLVPILRYRCDQSGGGTNSQSGFLGRGEDRAGRACCAGGGL